MPLAPGDVFAGYSVVRQLGAGGMGTVHLVRHPRLPRLEALKVLRPEYSSDAEFAQRFLREADVVAGLEHRNIVPVLDRGEDEGRLWLTMRYVDGVDAEEALGAAGGLLPAGRAVRIVAEVAAALDCAHRSNLVHRDVKPANVLLSRPVAGEPEQVFLTDFGIARPLDAATRLTRTGMVLATFDYASPEQVESRPLDARSDVYSLGCVLYRLLTGSVPFPGSSFAVALHGHLTLPPPRPTARAPWLPPGLDDVVARAMAKDPADRYPTCAALAADASAALDSYPAPPPDPFRVGVTPADGAPTTWLSSDTLGPAPRARLARLLQHTRFFDLPTALPDAAAIGTTTGVVAGAAPPRPVTLEVSSGGRTHRVRADLATAHRPPELDDLVDTVRELGSSAPPTRGREPVTVLERPRHAPLPAVPPASTAGPAVPAPAGPASAGPASAGPASARARPLPAHPPAVTSTGPSTPPPWLHQPAARISAAPPPGGSTGAGPPPPPRLLPAGTPSARLPARRRRRRVVVLAVVAALVGAGGTTWLLTHDDGGAGDDPAGRTPGADGSPGTDAPAAALAALPAAGALPDTAVLLSRETDGAADLYAVDSDSGEVLTRLTDAPEADVAPVLLAGRATVVYARSGDAGTEWRVVAADGSGDRTLFPDGLADCADPGRPSFDPTDPTRLALTCGDGAGGMSLRVVTLDGALVKVLHEGTATVGDPAWSPEGNEVAFFAGGDPDLDGGSLYLVDVSDPARRVQLTTGDDGEDADPSWSPDGRQLAWRREIAPGQRGIVAGSPDPSGDVRFLTSGAFDQDPVWSPDGGTIAYKSDRPGNAAPDGDQVWLVDADGSDPRQLPADEGAVVSALAWAAPG